MDNYSSKEFATIFEQHISEQANVLTDQWSGYRSLSVAYKIRQEKSIGGVNFKVLDTMVHQLK
jgi:hypothetical protein